MRALAAAVALLASVSMAEAQSKRNLESRKGWPTVFTSSRYEIRAGFAAIALDPHDDLDGKRIGILANKRQPPGIASRSR